MNKISLKSILLIIAVILVILTIVFPEIFAFANTFLDNKTMPLWKGESGKYCIYLQNTGDKDVEQIINILEGAEYIRNLDEINKQFNVPAGTVSDNLPVCMEVGLPRNSQKGVKYMISYGVTNSASKDNEGMVSFAPVQITEKFYLTEKLEEKKEDPAKYILPIAVAVIAFAAVGYAIYRKKRQLRK